MSLDLAAIDYSVLQGYALQWGGRLAAALLVFLIGKWLAGRLAAMLVKILERGKVDVTLCRFLRNICYYALLTAVVIAAASQLGINTASFLAVIGAASLAVGLALKDSLGNFAAGVMLILFRPFKVGDAVTVAGETGVVEEITIFNTVLNTFDNQRKIIPNATVSGDTITNITANPTRRIDLVFGIGYDDDLLRAKELIEEVLAAEPRILTDPAPLIAVDELASSSVNIVVRPWVHTTDFGAVRFFLIERIKNQFDQHGITIPYPQTDVHLHQELAQSGNHSSGGAA